MPRPIWTGNLSFGLLNIPVSLMPGERRVDLHFHLMDSRDKAAIRYERVNAETGEEVPWKQIVKAFEFKKGSYVMLELEDIQSAATDARETVDVQAFVNADDISAEYFERPYILVPGKKAQKGYVLLRETLKRGGKAGIARVVIRTREYLSAILPRGNALMLVLLRFEQELVDVDDYPIPDEKPSHYRITAKELTMAEQLVESMTTTWDPGEFKDEFRDRLKKVIEKRMKSKGALAQREPEEAETLEESAGNVVDFMALLKKSIAGNKRTPAKGKTPARKRGAKSSRKATTKKSARRPRRRTAS
jgi:DNA end-binding protein Ku